MDVRTFEAFTMKDAVKAVKSELGQDAVILSTRELPQADGSNKRIEIKAARAHVSRRSSSGASSRAAERDQFEAGQSRLDNLAIRLDRLADETATKRQVQMLETGFSEIKRLLLETLRDKEGSVLHNLPPAFVDVERQMRVMAVDHVHIAEMIKYLRSLPPPQKNDDPAEHYRDQAIRWMLKRVRIAPRWSALHGSTVVHTICGPTGSGKTSLVAKLAAYMHMKEKTPLVVVSMDDRRLAASEQLRVYCKILEVPFATINDGDEMVGLRDRYRDAALFLVDTAGKNPKGGVSTDSLRRLADGGLDVQYHLSVSTTDKEEQLDQAVRAFANLGLQSLMFSKLDESWSFGEIFNLSRKWDIPLSFFSIGQEIPDDLEAATRERVVERIFGI